MKHFTQLRTWLTMLLLFVGVSVSWGEEKTGTIVFGKNNVMINADNTSAKDNIGNTWSFQVVGTTSYTTTNENYMQIGSSSKPATSITFTTTLNESTTIKSMSAKFGGFSGTAGTVALKVGDTTIGTGSLNAANDVTVTSNTTADGTVLTIAITGINKGVKCYNISYTFDDGKSSIPTPVSGILLDKTSLNLKVGGKSTLTPTIAPSNASNKNIIWSSSKENVATVEGGVVTALAEGETTITAKTEDGNYTATCDVSVSPFVASYANTYTSGDGLLTTTGGTSASSATVIWNGIEYDAVKAGTSSAAGVVKISVPAGTNTLHLHIVGWNNEGKAVKIEGLADEKSMTIKPDAGISGGSPFTLRSDPEESHYYTIETNNSEVLTLTITATTGKRFILFGVNAEAGEVVPAKNLSSIEVKTAPAKTTYTEGETFDPSGLVITAKYNDDSTEDVAYAGNESKFTFSADVLAISDESVTITYAEKNCTQLITVNEAVKYTVTFDAQGGTCDTELLKETASGAGVVLPNATCNNDEWSFAGWATKACTETNEAPILYKGGATYTPTTDETLYAVYMYGVTSGETVFNRVTDINELKDGIKVVVVSNATNYALTLSSGDKGVVENTSSISMTEVKKIWTLTKTGNEYSLKDSQSTPKTLSTNGVPKITTENIASVGNLGASNGSYKYADWSITPSSISDCWVVTNTYTTENGIAALTVNSTPQWGVLNVNDSNGPRDASVFAMRIYAEGPAANATYNSNPIVLEDLTLSDNENVGYYANNYGTVTVSRTIKAGNWSTLCLPFNMTAEQIVENFGEGASVKTLSGLTAEGESLTLNFEETESVPAGTPCMVKATKDVASIVVKDRVGVLTDPDLITAPSASNGDYTVTFVGSYNGTSVAKDAGNYIISSNKFYYVNSAVTNKGFRAYFHVESATGSEVKVLSMSFDDNATSIIMVENEESNAVIYDMQGRKVSKAQKGLYIVNGKKVVR